MATALAKRTTTVTDKAVMYINKDIVTVFELELDGEIIKSGDKVKLKGDNRTTYTFRCVAENVLLSAQQGKPVAWVDLCGPQGFRSVRIDFIRAIKIVKKRSRRLKPNEALPE